MISVMTFNIAIGGDVVDLGRVAAAIEAADADVVGLQEAWGNGGRIAALLGWAHVDDQHQVISRLPLIAVPEGRGTHLLVQVRPGEVFALGNIHLPAYPYGPYALRDGATVASVEALERSTRLAALASMSPAWQRVIDGGMPLVVTGDFNSPSHTDRHQVRWPVSLAAENMGLIDTYRAANPHRPGISWTYGFPHPRLEPGELQDRIDFVLVAGADAIHSCALVGPGGVPDVDIAVDPWPSDHLAVVARLEVPPVAPAPFVAVERPTAAPGEAIRVRYHAPGGSQRSRISLRRDDTEIAWLPPLEAEHFGQVSFGSVVPGLHEVALVEDGAVVSSTEVWVLESGSRPRVSARRTAGDRVEVRWWDTGAYKNDRVAVYRRGDADLLNGSLSRVKTGATVTGSVELDADNGPLTVRLFLDGGSVVLDQVDVD